MRSGSLNHAPSVDTNRSSTSFAPHTAILRSCCVPRDLSASARILTLRSVERRPPGALLWLSAPKPLSRPTMYRSRKAGVAGRDAKRFTQAEWSELLRRSREMSAVAPADFAVKAFAIRMLWMRVRTLARKLAMAAEPRSQVGPWSLRLRLRRARRGTHGRPRSGSEDFNPCRA